MEDAGKVAEEFFQISSEQRLSMILKLSENPLKLSELAKSLNATVPEVRRNLERLTKAGQITKNSDGKFTVTTYGTAIINVIPLVNFLSKNRDFFQDHSFGDLPQKFISRAGAFSQCQYIKGVTRVMEHWKEIVNNSNEYIFGIVYEEPADLIEPIVKKAQKGVIVNSIFSKSAITPKDRKKILEKLKVNVTKNKNIERKIIKNVKLIVTLNEKEAAVNFPFLNGEVDMSKMFYGNDPAFHEWCLDYFRYCWYGSESFFEEKLQKN